MVNFVTNSLSLAVRSGICRDRLPWRTFQLKILFHFTVARLQFLWICLFVFLWKKKPSWFIKSSSFWRESVARCSLDISINVVQFYERWFCARFIRFVIILLLFFLFSLVLLIQSLAVNGCNQAFVWCCCFLACFIENYVNDKKNWGKNCEPQSQMMHIEFFY